MGRQFKTIAPTSGQAKGEMPDREEMIAAQDTFKVQSVQEVKPLLRLPMRSVNSPISRDSTMESETPEPARPPGLRDRRADPQSDMPGIVQTPLSEGGRAPISQAGTINAPGAPAFKAVHPLSASPETPRPASLAGLAEAPRALPVPERIDGAEKSEKTRNKRKRSPFMTAAMVAGCLAILLLSAGGLWLHQGHSGSATQTVTSTSTVPAARPTEYTIVIPDKTGATPVLTATAKSGKGVDRFSLNSVLSPVPMPWQTNGPLIVVSINAQKLTAYDQGKPVMTSLVTTGMPALYTPQGTYHIIGRIANAMFTSPWPPSSPYYYAPIHVNYGLQLTTSGIYLHDATWRSVFGPGTNVPHKDPIYGEESGSHGCVELPLQAMRWLYTWAPNGIAVAVVP